MPTLITPHSGEFRQFLRTGALRVASWACGRSMARVRITSGRWARGLGRNINGVTIELFVHDQFALACTLRDLSQIERDLLGWSEARRDKLYTRVMAPSLRGYEGWHPGEEGLTPVILSRSEWQMIDRLCQNLRPTEPEAWHDRVIERIRPHLYARN